MRLSPLFKVLASALTLALLSGSWLVSCAEQQQFDSQHYLRQQLTKLADPRLAEDLGIPFELTGETAATVAEKLKPAGDTRARVSRILDYIFRGLDLQYELAPTRDAIGTFESRKGNCLSFVNLFVGIGREMRLDPFYVEVEDYQRWDHRQGMVVSQGHIVAGLYVRGELRTYDFLPYRVKSYRDFRPIDDLTATAHYYNNLGAEALLAGDMETALEHLTTASRVDPTFVKAANNLAVWHARSGSSAEAEEILLQALELEPDNVPLLSNLARAYQVTGRHQEATRVLDEISGVKHVNPFFFVYQGEVALARGDTQAALVHMRDALRLDSETPEVHIGLVKVYVATGDLTKARHHLDRAQKLDPSHPETHRLSLMLRPGLETRDPS